MNKYERLLFILNLIRTRKNLTARELAERCEVTERTIFRDITALSAANIPIYYDRGYKLLTDCFLPTLNFDLGEYLTLREALRTTPLRNLPEYKRALKALEAKIEACLSAPVDDQRKAAGDQSALTIKERPATDRSALWFGMLEEAIRSRVVVRMEYDSLDSGVSEREVEPVFTLYANGKFYFVGYCLRRSDYRTFRLSRIRDVALTAKRFKRHRNVDPETYFADSWSVFDGEILEAHIEFYGRSARVVRTGSYLKREQKQSLPNGVLEYRARVAGVEEIGRWVLGFGSEARVCAPEELRRWVCDQAAGTMQANGASDQFTGK